MCLTRKSRLLMLTQAAAKILLHGVSVNDPSRLISKAGCLLRLPFKPIASTKTSSRSSATPLTLLQPMPAPSRADASTPLAETLLLGSTKRTLAVSSTWFHSPCFLLPLRHVANCSRSDSPRCPSRRTFVIGDSASRPQCPASVSQSPPFDFRQPFRPRLAPVETPSQPSHC